MHQIEQFLTFTGAADARVTASCVANYAHPCYPQFEDFGDAMLTADNGSTLYFRVDWFTPDGLSSWGDGRCFILGTTGSIELRKNLDIAGENEGDHLFLSNEKGEQHLRLAGKVGYPFFGQLILDCLQRSENAMTQAHAFKAAELSLRAQQMAERL